MELNGMKVSNPLGAYTYDVAVIFTETLNWVEVQANTTTEAAKLVESKGYKLATYEDTLCGSPYAR